MPSPEQGKTVRDSTWYNPPVRPRMCPSAEIVGPEVKRHEELFGGDKGFICSSEFLSLCTVSFWVCVRVGVCDE